MKEEQFKALMENSLVKTSEGFTDKLMSEIEAQSSLKKIRTYFIMALIICIVLLLLIPQLQVNFRSRTFQLKLYPKAIRIVSTLIILLFINHLMSLRSRLRHIKHLHI